MSLRMSAARHCGNRLEAEHLAGLISEAEAGLAELARRKPAFPARWAALLVRGERPLSRAIPTRSSLCLRLTFPHRILSSRRAQMALPWVGERSSSGREVASYPTCRGA